MLSRYRWGRRVQEPIQITRSYSPIRRGGSGGVTAVVSGVVPADLGGVVQAVVAVGFRKLEACPQHLEEEVPDSDENRNPAGE